MGKVTLDQLRALRESGKKEMNNRLSEGKTIEIIVGMGTCGIAAGGKLTLNSFLDELSSMAMQNPRWKSACPACLTPSTETWMRKRPKKSCIPTSLKRNLWTSTFSMPQPKT